MGGRSMDLLSDILNVVRLSGTLYFRTSFSGQWGVQVPAFSNVCRFHYAHRGGCYVRVGAGGEPLHLAEGDLVLITRGADHVLSDPAGAPVSSLDDVVKSSGFTGRGALVVNSDDFDRNDTQLICGHFAFAEDADHPLLGALPPYIHLRAFGAISPAWMEESLKIIKTETSGASLGGDLIALKLSEIIFTQAVRAFLADQGRSIPGLAGYSDPNLTRALAAMHDDPAKAWTVEALGRIAGMSRSVFAERFTEQLSVAPLTYLTEWRMQLARRLLVDSKLPILDVAERAGYNSEASFGRAFKRHFNMGPAGYRRHHLAAAEGLVG